MGNVLKKMKQCFGDMNFKSSCLSSCCVKVEADIDIDLDGDDRPDVHIEIKDGEIEVETKS